jgi:hypothetical protein
MTVDGFVDRLLLFYGPPESLDDAAFVDEYRKMLMGNSERVLKAASDLVRDTHVRRGWPTPGEVKAALRLAAHRLGPLVPAQHRKLETAPEQPLTPEEIAARKATNKRIDEMAKDFIRTHRVTPGSRCI